MDEFQNKEQTSKQIQFELQRIEEQYLVFTWIK